MRIIRKIFVVTAVVFAIFFATGIFIAEKYEKVLINYLIKDVNKFVKSEIRIKNVDVTFLKKFPKISVWLKNTYIESVDKTYSDTLLYVNDIYIQFDFLKLVKKDFEINSLEFHDGICNLNISSKGENNYIFWEVTDKKETQLDLNLNKIKLNNISVTYNNQLKLFNSEFNINSTSLSGKISGNDWNFDINQNIALKKFSLKNIDYVKSTIDLSSNLSILKDSIDIKINNGNLSLGNTHFLIDGSIGDFKDPLLDLSIVGNGISIGNSLNLLRKSNIISEKGIKSNGDINFQAFIKGKASHKKLPHITGNFDINNGEVNFKKEKLLIKNINLNGNFDNNNKKDLSYSTLLINNFSYSINNKTSLGSLRFENFHSPKVNLDIKGNAPLRLIDKLIGNPYVKNSDGHLTYDLNIDGKFTMSKNIKKKDISYLNIVGKVKLDNCNILLDKKIKSINKINGELSFNKKTSIHNFGFFINKNDFLINGEIQNLLDYILNNSELKANIDLFSNNLDITDFIKSSNNNTTQKASAENIPLKLPDDLLINGNFTINNFKLADFDAKNSKGKMTYRNKLLTLNSVFFKSMEGDINGGGVLTQTTDNNFYIKAQTKLNNINITEMMESFNNFGQKIINEKQISGQLNGNATLSLQLNNNFKIDKNTASLNSYVEIKNGRLANFTPLMGLSRFFKSSELADIQFSRFENSIAISNKTIYFTDMKINSSVTDLLGSGVHGFDNSYEYKVKLKLSEILSGKTDKPEITSTQFGVLEEEETKNTYIPIKITGVGDDIKVSADFKETKKSIKSHVNKEKQTLNTIFKEEFGKGKNDTVIKKDTTKKKKPTFKIVWEEEEN